MDLDEDSQTVLPPIVNTPFLEAILRKKRVCVFLLLLLFSNLILGFPGNSEGGVRLGMLFYFEWWWNYAEIRFGGRFMVDLGVRKHFLSITNEFERNYLISLR